LGKKYRLSIGRISAS